jgi:hypothetical protein
MFGIRYVASRRRSSSRRDQSRRPRTAGQCLVVKVVACRRAELTDLYRLRSWLDARICEMRALPARISMNRLVYSLAVTRPYRRSPRSLFRCSGRNSYRRLGALCRQHPQWRSRAQNVQFGVSGILGRVGLACACGPATRLSEPNRPASRIRCASSSPLSESSCHRRHHTRNPPGSYLSG